MNQKDKKDFKKIIQESLRESWNVRDIKENVTRMRDRVDYIGAEAIDHGQRLDRVETKIHLST